MDEHVNELEKQRRTEFIRWLNDLKLQYINYEMGRGNKTPNDYDFAMNVLGQKPASYSRWVSGDYTPNDMTLLQIAVNTMSIEPLRIFGKESMLGGDPGLAEIVVNFRRLPPVERQNFLRKAQELGERGANFPVLKNGYAD
jgi:hypothetical protein